MANDIFSQYDVYGNKLGGYSGISSYQTQNAVPLNINTPYSQIVDDNELKPTDASRISGARLYDAVVAMDGTGDYTDIQTALNAGKKRLYIRSGIYSITKSINIYNNDILIHGEDRYETIIRVSPSVSTALTIFNLGSSAITVLNIQINNLTIDGNRDVLVGQINAIVLYKSQDVFINNCYITNCDYGIISFGNTGNYVYKVYIYNNYILNTGVAIEPYGSNNLTETYNWWIYNNYIEVDDSSTAGIYIVGGYHINIINNYISSSSYSIFAGASYECNIDGNILIANPTTCIYINSSDTNNTYKFKVTNNIISSSRNGIEIRGSLYNTISGNLLLNCGSESNNTWSGIFFKDGAYGDYSSYNIVSSNIINSTVANKLKYGIIEQSLGNNYNIISGNIVTGYTTSGITINGANTIVSDNIEQP